MSDREKKLVLLFGLAAFVLANVFGVSWFRKQRDRLAAEVLEAEGNVQTAEAFDRKFDTVLEEMEWMAEHAPKERSGQLVATELEQYVSNQATTHALTVKRRAILPNDQSGTHFHRAKSDFNVTGREDSLYRWLDRLQMPEQFRAITFLRLSPDTKDDTLIDCTVTVEQWYVPLSGEAEAEEAPAPAATPGPSPTPAPTPAPVPVPSANPPTPAGTPAATPAPAPENEATAQP
jgi:hypothetical protein